MRDLQLGGEGDPAKPVLASDPQELWEKKCSFKPLHFGVVCYTAIVRETEFGLVTRPEIP